MEALSLLLLRLGKGSEFTAVLAHFFENESNIKNIIFMKKNILTLGAIALLFAACQNNGSQNNTMTDTTESTIMTTPADEKQVPEVVATYVGTLPCCRLWWNGYCYSSLR